MKSPVQILRDALSEITDMAERCDSWESFPSAPIEGARQALALTAGAEADTAMAGSVDTSDFSALAARYGTTKAGKDYMTMCAHIDAHTRAALDAQMARIRHLEHPSIT